MAGLLARIIAAVQISADLERDIAAARSPDSDGGEEFTARELAHIGVDVLKKVDKVYPLPGGVPALPEFSEEMPTAGGIYWNIPSGYDGPARPVLVLKDSQGRMVVQSIGSEFSADISILAGSRWQGPITPY